jgi:hypothetical protein
VYPTILHRLSLTDCIREWDKWDDKGRDLAGIRALSLADRFYLLVKVCRRADMLHPWIYARCREVEAEPDGYLDLWAREHYKSTIITFGGVMQEILRNPEITVGIFSHVKPIAQAFLAQIKREFESNEVLKAAFPDVLYSQPEREAPAGTWSLQGGITVKRQSNPKEMTIEAHGLVDGQPISRHFGLMVYDDVVTRESVNTPEQIAKTTEAWELSDNLGSVGGRKWHVGTRYSYADTYDAIIKRKAVQVRLHPATADGLIDGKPVLLTQEDWDRRKRDQGEATIACQMLQNPLAGQQRMFDVADLRVYEIRPETLAVYVLVDPGRSKKKDSANTAVVVIGLDYASNKYLLDGYDHKMDLRERWERTREMYAKWKRMPGVQGVHVGYESFGAQADLDYFKEQMGKEGPGFPIAELAWPRDSDVSKIDRVQRLGPDIRGHKLFLPYQTDPKNLTANQRKMVEQGYQYRIATPIRRKDENGNVYDVSEHLRLQVHYFPFGGKKDVIDAVARIYDMEPRAPIIIDTSRLEPEYT